LIHDNCCTIEDVRRRLAGKTLSLERNQLVGVECYEDILEEMPRDEAARIGQIIEKHTLSIYGEAEVRIMGSYRRGKQTCGDVDVHITCKKFEKKIPADALGNIVDSLWRNGHLCFHLTFLDGMETGSELDDYQRAGRCMGNQQGSWSTKEAKNGKSIVVLHGCVQFASEESRTAKSGY
jgi:predicted nucleotidyltransferase